MARKSLADTVASEILRRITDGELIPGDVLPSEAQIGNSLNVSRLTVREAFKELHTKNVLRPVRGKGTYVNDFSSWTDLQALVRVMSGRRHEFNAPVQLLEVRRMIEVESAELAATRRTERDIWDLSDHLASMKMAHETANLVKFVDADIAFHDAIMKATGNLLVAVILKPLSELLESGRRETSSITDIQLHAIEFHGHILRAIEAGSPEQARDYMAQHMDQTLNDLNNYILNAGSTAKTH